MSRSLEYLIFSHNFRLERRIYRKHERRNIFVMINTYEYAYMEDWGAGEWWWLILSRNTLNIQKHELRMWLGLVDIYLPYAGKSVFLDSSCSRTYFPKLLIYHLFMRVTLFPLPIWHIRIHFCLRCVIGSFYWITEHGLVSSRMGGRMFSQN